MFAENIHNIAESISRRYGRNPMIAAQELNIKLIRNYEFKKLLGMYTVIKRRRIIIFNANLGHELQRIVVAHELGHDRLHREFAVNRIVHEATLYDMTARPEYEANMFAAELLVSDGDVIELMRTQGYSAAQAASTLGLTTGIIDIKLCSMELRGV